MDAGPARRRDGQADCAREPVARDGAAALAMPDLKPWRRKMWCIPQVDADYVARMEDVLDPRCRGAGPAAASGSASTRARSSSSAKVRLADRPVSGGRALRLRVPARRNRQSVRVPRRQPSRRKVKSPRVARRSTSPSACANSLTSIIRKPNSIRVVLDNLSTHSAGAFYQAFPAEQARRLLRRIELHYVPKHASWLNMVEIEIEVFCRWRCLDRRIESYPPPHRRSRRLGEAAQRPPKPASTGSSHPKRPAPKSGEPIRGPQT